MVNVNKLWSQDKLEDVFNRFNETYNFKDYVDMDIQLTKRMANSIYGCMEQSKRTPPYRDIKRVIFNPPATIILWGDNTKSVVKCQPGDTFDAEKGFVLAYLKKLLGNDNTFNKEINKWVYGE